MIDFFLLRALDVKLRVALQTFEKEAPKRRSTAHIDLVFNRSHIQSHDSVFVMCVVDFMLVSSPRVA